MKVAINYANTYFIKAQKMNTKSAYKYGGFDKVFEYTSDNLDSSFKEKHCKILEKSRGNGYWIWKPYIICDALSKIEYGDYLFYCDSGAIFVKSIDYLIKCMEENLEDIMVFETPFIEFQWTKNEILHFFNVENQENITKTAQRLASYILIKKTENSECFFEEYLSICDLNENFLDDSLNYKDKSLIENRHDQSILSILSKIRNIKAHRDPSEYGKRPYIYKIFKSIENKKNKIKYNLRESYDNSDYPQIIWAHRSATGNILSLFMSWCRSYMPICIVKILTLLNIKIYNIKKGLKNEK